MVSLYYNEILFKQNFSNFFCNSFMIINAKNLNRYFDYFKPFVIKYTFPVHYKTVYYVQPSVHVTSTQ